jgi:hypothetical protein
MEFPAEIVTRADIVARIVLSCLIVSALLLIRLPKLRRFEAWAYGLAGVTGVAAFFNFGIAFHQWDWGFVDRWEQFHYQLGSKYFPELGYDGLYVASVLAHWETTPDFPIQRIRDLRSNRFADPASMVAHLREVRSRFSEARWRDFLSDHQNYVDHSYSRMWERVRQDHGYNPTPAWTFVARIFAARLPSTNATLNFLGSLDVLLLAALFALVFRSYGYRAACLGLAIAGLGYGWRFMYIGTFLRLDWLAALVVACCMLKRERFGWAGACIGYATMVRIFPVLFLAGPALLALKALLQGDRPRWALRLAAGFGAVVLLGFVGGSMVGRGASAWTEFAKSMQLYRQTWMTTVVGVDTLFLSSPSFLLANLDAPVERRTYAGVRQLLDENRPGRIAASGLLLAIFALAVWNASLAESVILGMAVVFALSPAAAYYWIMLLAVPLRRGRSAALALLVVSAGMHWIHRLYPTPEYEPWRYAILAWSYALFLIAWMLPATLRTLRARGVVGDPPRRGVQANR